MTKYFIPHSAIQTWNQVCILDQTNWTVKCQCIQNLMEILFIGIVSNDMQKSKYILMFFNSAQLYPVSFFNSYSIIFCTCVVSFHILASAYIFERMI